MKNFVGLHNHTHYSILDALSSPKDLIKKAKELGQKSIAITDHATFAGIWDGFKVAKEQGVKLIVGCEFNFLDNAKVQDKRIRHIILLAKNHTGYKNLLLLNKLGYDNSFIFSGKNHPVIDWELLENNNSGLICLTACSNGIIGQLLNQKNFEEAERQSSRLKDIFGDNLGLEVQANNLSRSSNSYQEGFSQQFTNFHLTKLSEKLNIKLVPTVNSHYINKEDAKMHDVFLAIGARQPVYSNNRIKYDLPEFYVKSGDEMFTFFSRGGKEEWADSLLENTLYFDEKCESPDWVDPKYSNPSGKELPNYDIQADNSFNDFSTWLSIQSDEIKLLDADKAFMRFKCESKLDSLCFDKDKKEIYLNRLKEEYEVIEFHGFSSYMLIVADFIRFAKENNVSVGPGRGSVGGSLVGFLLDIHVADPIKYNLIFARFHNKEKSSFPDIDTDFSKKDRWIIQNYVESKYGFDKVAHVSNIMTLTPKPFVKDICRAGDLGKDRQKSVNLGIEISAVIPVREGEEMIRTYAQACKKSALFVEYTKLYKELDEYKSLCGNYRAWATHAAGVVIGKRPLHEIIPLRKDKNNISAIELDKEKAEELGLIKMDLLGLETLDIIDDTFELIKNQGKQVNKEIKFDEYDQKTYDLITSGKTFCVFQLGTSPGTIDLCKNVKPKSIQDLAHINALARPAARNIREDFIATKEGKKKVQLLHPALKRSFGFTYGFGLYEESLMYLAQDIAGWSLHGADRLRKLTKEKGKNPEKVAKWREEFISGAITNNIPKETAIKVWDDVVVPFGGYGFNLSHAIFYSVLGFKTAYLKAHYPVEFLTANLMAEINSAAPDAPKNIEKIKKELKDYGVEILAPNINKSNMHYELISNNQLLTGLNGIKYVGDDCILDILEKRPFSSFYDFISRTDSTKVRANAIQALAAAGALDCFGISRKNIFLYTTDYRKKAQTWAKRKTKTEGGFEYSWPEDKDWSLSEKYALEMKFIGEAYICGITQAYGNFFNKSWFKPIKEIKNLVNKEDVYSVKGIVKDFFELKIKKEGSKYFGQAMLKLKIEDPNGDQCFVTIFPKDLELFNNKLKTRKIKSKFGAGFALHFKATVNEYENENQLILNDLIDVSIPPLEPADLKSKSSKKEKTVKSEILSNKEIEISNSSNDLLEAVEDQLFDQGLIEFNDSEDD